MLSCLKELEVSVKIPKHIVEDHKRGVEDLKFYGYPVSDLDRDELLAMVNCLARQLKEERERLLANLSMMRVMRNA